MAEVTAAVAGSTVIVKADPEDGVFDSITGFYGSLIDGEAVNSREALWGAITIGAAAFLTGGYFGRQRALNGDKPIAGFIL